MSTRSTDLPPSLREALADHAERAELEQLWQALGAVAPVPAVEPSARDQAWQSIAARTAPAPRPTLRVVRGNGTPRPRWWTLAAAASFAAMALATGRPATTRWETRTETDRIVRLDDGSVVQLSAGTRLSAPRQFRGWFGRPRAEREVALEGEAFFTVARDGRPFIVRTKRAVVRVLGTRFDVRDVAGDDRATVIVEEGRVRVRGNGAPDSLDLSARDRARVGRAMPIERDTVVPARWLAWRSGGLVLVDQSIDAVLRELGRRYGLAFEVEPSVPVRERLTVYYPSLPAIETVLADVATSRALRYQRTSRGFRLAAVTE